MADFRFDAQDLTRIKDAVNEAEKKTSGEIATAFIKESDNYALYELVFALTCGLLWFILATFFADSVELTLKQIFSGYTIRYLLVFYLFTTTLVTILFYVLANLTFLNRRIIPKRVMAEKVKQRANRYFTESGIGHTKNRSGILIFISYMEHRVELVADSGIDAKISQEKWNAVISHILEGLENRKLVDHLCYSIQQCGLMLATYFPVREDNVNEVEDDIDLLER